MEADLRHPDTDDSLRNIAARWLDYGIDRSVVKRNVMTFAYSSEVFGFKHQLLSDLMQPLADEVLEGKRQEHPFGEDGGFKASLYLAKIVWQAVNIVVSQAARGMKFFQAIAGLLAHEKKEMIWTTPVGFPVVHKYNDWQTKTVELFLYDRKLPVIEASTKDKVEDEDVFRRVKMNIRTQPEETIKKSKQKSAVAPNVIHSMDAAHLLLTVLRAKREGIESFSLIHDSFATHAADTERFFRLIREEFVHMYEEHDVFWTIWQQAYEVLSEEGRDKLPRLPTKGVLDLQEVIQSDYAFS